MPPMPGGGMPPMPGGGMPPMPGGPKPGGIGRDMGGMPIGPPMLPGGP